MKILLPEHQLNKKIYNSFENLLNNFNSDNWIRLYILWELSLIKELGYEINLLDGKNYLNTPNYTVGINNKTFKVPELLLKHNIKNVSKTDITEALIFNKNLLLENFIFPNRIKLPLSRNILEKYFY